MDQQITVIELTPCNVRLLTGYCMDDSIKVMQCLEGENLPINEKGLPEKVDLKTSLMTLINKAKSQLKVELGPMVFLYPPIGYKPVEISENTATGNEENRLSRSEYASCNIRAIKKIAEVGKKGIYLAPFNFKVDNHPNLDYFPLGTMTRSFEVDGDIHMVDWESYTYFRNIIDGLGIKPYMELVSSYAASQFLDMKHAEKNYILLEMEPEYTVVSYLSFGRLISSALPKENYSMILKRYAQALGISMPRAEELIHTFGLLPKFDFEYLTDEGFDVPKLASTLVHAMIPFLTEINALLSEKQIPSEVPVILTGQENEIFAVDSCIGQLLKRKCRLSNERILGANGAIFDPLLGAVRVASYNYQLSRETYRRNQFDTELKSTMFDR